MCTLHILPNMGENIKADLPSPDPAGFTINENADPDVVHYML